MILKTFFVFHLQVPSFLFFFTFTLLRTGSFFIHFAYKFCCRNFLKYLTCECHIHLSLARKLTVVTSRSFATILKRKKNWKHSVFCFSPPAPGAHIFHRLFKRSHVSEHRIRQRIKTRKDKVELMIYFATNRWWCKSHYSFEKDKESILHITCFSLIFPEWFSCDILKNGYIVHRIERERTLKWHTLKFLYMIK